MSVLLEDNACPLKAVVVGALPTPAQMPPYETFPDTEAKLDPPMPRFEVWSWKHPPAEERVLA